MLTAALFSNRVQFTGQLSALDTQLAPWRRSTAQLTCMTGAEPAKLTAAEAMDSIRSRGSDKPGAIRTN